MKTRINHRVLQACDLESLLHDICSAYCNLLGLEDISSFDTLIYYFLLSFIFGNKELGSNTMVFLL